MTSCDSPKNQGCSNRFQYLGYPDEHIKQPQEDRQVMTKYRKVKSRIVSNYILFQLFGSYYALKAMCFFMINSTIFKRIGSLLEGHSSVNVKGSIWLLCANLERRWPVVNHLGDELQKPLRMRLGRVYEWIYGIEQCGLLCNHGCFVWVEFTLRNRYRLQVLYLWEFQDTKMEVLYHMRPYVVGMFPYIALAQALYMAGLQVFYIILLHFFVYIQHYSTSIGSTG